MAAVDFKLYPDFQARILSMKELSLHVKVITDLLAANVKANAPVFTGYFGRSIWLQTAMSGGSVRGYVGSNDPARHLIEFGGAHTPAYAPFRRAVQRLGLRLEGGGRG